jgi:hypothetical protein
MKILTNLLGLTEVAGLIHLKGKSFLLNIGNSARFFLTVACGYEKFLLQGIPL